MNYLHNTTKDWENIPNIEMNYTDEGSNYGGIVTELVNEKLITEVRKKDNTATATFENLKARMPYFLELKFSNINCTVYSANNQLGECQLTGEFLYDNLNEGGYSRYWILSTDASYETQSWTVLKGKASAIMLINENVGVRPVITVEI